MTLVLLPRGKALFVKVDEQAPQNIVSFLNAILAENEVTKGIEVECGPVQGSTGNYAVSLAGEAWKQGATANRGYARLKALTLMADKLIEGGVPEFVNDQAIINLQHSGQSRGEGQGRVAVLRLYLNIANMQPAHQTGGTTVVQQVDPNAKFNDEIEKLSAQYFEKGLDEAALEAASKKFSPPVFVGWLKGKLGVTGTPAAAPTTGSTGGATEGEQGEGGTTPPKQIL